MKVLHLTTYYRPDIGGVAEHIFHLNRFLNRIPDVESRVLHVVENAEETRLNRISDTEWKLFVKGNLEDYRKITRAKEIRNLISTDRELSDVHLLHVHTLNRLEFVAWKWKPWVWTAHLSFIPQLANSMLPKDILLKFLLRIVFMDAMRLIAVSRHQIPLIQKITGRKDISIVPNGIDVDSIREKARRKPEGIPEDKFRIFCPSKWRRLKGIDVLVSAMEYLEEHHKEDMERMVFILIRSNGEYGKQIMESLEKFKNVILIEPQAPESMPGYYGISNLIVIPSRYESFGISILEAMALGKPVIATKTGGIPDIITDGVNGLLVENENPVDMAEKIIMVFREEKLRRHLGENAYKRAEEFSWDKVSRRVYDLYKRAINFNGR